MNTFHEVTLWKLPISFYRGWFSGCGIRSRWICGSNQGCTAGTQGVVSFCYICKLGCYAVRQILFLSLLLTLILLVFYLIHIFNFQGVFWFCRHAISRGKRWKLPMPSNNIFVDFIGFVRISGKTRNRYFFIGLSEALLSWKIYSSAPVQYWGSRTIFSYQNFYL